MRLRNTMPWPTRILHSIEVWPCHNIINDLGMTNNGQVICVACNKRNIVSRVILYGQPYNPNTIGPTQLDGRFTFDKVIIEKKKIIELLNLFRIGKELVSILYYDFINI